MLKHSSGRWQNFYSSEDSTLINVSGLSILLWRVNIEQGANDSCNLNSVDYMARNGGELGKRGGESHERNTEVEL